MQTLRKLPTIEPKMKKTTLQKRKGTLCQTSGSKMVVSIVQRLKSWRRRACPFSFFEESAAKRSPFIAIKPHIPAVPKPKSMWWRASRPVALCFKCRKLSNVLTHKLPSSTLPASPPAARVGLSRFPARRRPGITACRGQWRCDNRRLWRK